jgi:CubicO group peptidase (beta-lactamase class C family)
MAIVESEEIVHTQDFCRVRPGGEVPTPQMPFPFGSPTKSFTAIAVMQLLEAGKVDLDAPVQAYLPWIRVLDLQTSAEITVRQLLDQTIGIPTTPGWSTLADFDQDLGAMEW